MALQSFSVHFRDTETDKRDVVPMRGIGIGDIQGAALERIASKKRTTGQDWEITRIEPR